MATAFARCNRDNEFCKQQDGRAWGRLQRGLGGYTFAVRCPYLAPTTLKRSSIEKKMSVYLASIRNGYHKDAFGQTNARVFWLVDSRYSGLKRLESLLEMNRHLIGGRGSRAFLFALREPLMKSPNARNAPVINGKGEQISLID